MCINDIGIVIIIGAAAACHFCFRFCVTRCCCCCFFAVFSWFFFRFFFTFEVSFLPIHRALSLGLPPFRKFYQFLSVRVCVSLSLLCEHVRPLNLYN